MSTPTVSWDETSPAGNTNISLGDNRIREMKTQIREVIDVDHDFPSSGNATDVGQHKKCTFQEQADLGTGAVNATILGSQTVSGKGELLYSDEDNNDIQITDNGKLRMASMFRTGDMLLTSSSTVPTGFTDVSATYNDKFIRISSSTALSTGGSNTHDHGAATGSHTLTTDEIPAHSHSETYYNNADGGTAGPAMANSGPTGAFSDDSVGGGQGHTHTIASADNIPAYVQMKMYQRS